MKKSVMLFAPILLVGLACSEKQASSYQEVEPEDLNVIIIHVDDLGWADVATFGSDFYQTPHIDQLAKQGLKFTSSYAAAAICSPTRAAMLTGKYPASTGITDWIRARFQGGVIPEDGNNPQGYDENGNKPLRTPKNYLYMPLSEVTIAELLKERGYRTAHIGKWHLGPDEYFPEHQGFDINLGGCDLGQPPSYFDPYKPHNGDESYVIPNLPPRKEGEYLTDREGDEAVRFIAENKDQKFFLHWASYTVHTPLMGKEELVDKYDSLKRGKQNNPVYAAMVESLDDNVGKIMTVLDSLDLADNTLLIFTSDNGGLMGSPKNQVTNNSPLRSQKGYPYEGGIRVPTIMRLPGKIPAGELTHSPIITMDVLPTVLGLVDGDVDDQNWDGMDLKEVFDQPGKEINRDLFWHFPHYRGSDVIPYSIVRSGDYKLIKYHDGRQGELYNLKDDLGENNNLIETEKDIERNLSEKLNDWLENTGAKMPKPKG